MSARTVSIPECALLRVNGFQCVVLDGWCNLCATMNPERDSWVFHGFGVGCYRTRQGKTRIYMVLPLASVRAFWKPVGLGWGLSGVCHRHGEPFPIILWIRSFMWIAGTVIPRKDLPRLSRW